MRLNTRDEIMLYLGRSPRDRVGWRRTRSEYAGALHYLARGNRVWARTEDIDALDLARSLTVAQAVKLKREAVGGCGRDFGLERLSKKIFPPLAGARKQA